jgi:segregation and condensation protein B
VSTDERPESLAAQAAAWVPPWERPPALPDADYAAAASAATPSSGLDDDDEPGEADTDVPAELPPVPGEATGPVTVDAPQPLDGDEEAAPTDVDPEMPDVIAPELPDPDDEPNEVPAGGGVPVDAPAPVDGDDAGSVFDAAADDDVSDNGEIDLPAVESGEVDSNEPQSDDSSSDDASADSSSPDSTFSDSSSSVVSSTASLAAGSPSIGSLSEESGFGGAAPVTATGAPNGRKRPVSGIPAQGRGKKDAGSAAVAADRRTPARSEAALDGAGADARSDEADLLPPIDDTELRAALEAILLVVDEPVAEMQLAQIMEQPTERVAAMLEDISAAYTAAGHGFDLRRAAGGWRLYTRPEYAPYVERFVLDGQSTRLTQAALETLAVVAYKQPVSRSRISVIRGVNCDGVMRTLVTRGLIEECGTESETGAFLYRTTVLFLEKLGLNSVDQLPALAPFLPDDVEEVFDAQR